MNNNKTGIELIAQERKEQMYKHGWDAKHDKAYKNKELVQAAEFCLTMAGCKGYNGYWPKGWDVKYMNKILNKSKVEQITVAGAFYMAEGDRQGYGIRIQGMVDWCAAEIDRLNYIQNEQ